MSPLWASDFGLLWVHLNTAPDRARPRAQQG